LPYWHLRKDPQPLIPHLATTTAAMARQEPITATVMMTAMTTVNDVMITTTGIATEIVMTATAITTIIMIAIVTMTAAATITATGVMWITEIGAVMKSQEGIVDQGIGIDGGVDGSHDMKT